MGNIKLEFFNDNIKRFFYRLIELFSLYLIPALLFCIIFRATLEIISNFVSNIFFPKEPYWLDLTLLFLLCLTIMFIMAHAGIITFHRRREGLSIIKYWLQHLPAWLFAWIFVIICQISQIHIFLVKHRLIAAIKTTYMQSFISILVLVSVVIVFIILNEIFRYVKRDKNHAIEYHYTGNIKETEALKSWLSYEEPIENPKQDIWNNKIISRRIAKILLDSSNIKLQKIGLIGPYGSGKTSILNLVSYYLQNPLEVDEKSNKKGDEFIVCIVSAWGQHNDCKVSEFILEQVVKTIEHEFNCLEITGLPQAYQLAIRSTGATYSNFFTTLFTLQPTPEETLTKLDQLLDKVGRKLVIYLEDCDRNHNQHQFYVEISTLFDRIGNLHNVSFVFSVGQMKEMEDVLAKITDHNEIVPKISQPESKLILANFLSLCKIDLSTTYSHLFSTLKDDMSFDNDILFSIVLSKMIIYPRTFKQVFWHTFSTWEKLKNEISFDDLFLVMLLKTTRPEAYSFINDNINQLRTGFGFNPLLSTDKTAFLEKIKQAWANNSGEILEIVDSPPRGKSFAYLSPSLKIVEYLFPKLNNLIGTTYLNKENQLNGISTSYPTDYWIRLHAGEIPQGEITDCETMAVLEEIKKRKYDNAFIKIEENAIWSDKIFQFGTDYFNNQSNVQDIIEKVIDRLIEKNKLVDFKGNAFINRFNNFIFENFDYDKNFNWISNIIRKTIMVNVEFSNEFYFAWISNFNDNLRRTGNMDQDKLHNSKLIELANKRISIIKETFSNKPEILLNSLKKSDNNMYPYSNLVYLLLYPIGSIDWTDFKYSTWNFLIPVIMSAAKIDKDLIIPQIIELMFKISIRPFPTNTIISVEQRNYAKELFGDKYTEALMQINKYDFKMEDKNLCEAFNQCREKTQELLNKEEN